MILHRVRPLVLVLLAAACHSGVPSTTPSPAPFPDDLKWMRTSAEYPALTLEIYRAATTYVRAAARGLPAGSWAVILDADETILDNSEHERRLVVAGTRFSDATWAPWVRERAAPAVPGAVAFVQAVQAAGGRIVVVTNRADSLCSDTRSNLESVGVRADLVLCQPVGPSDKNPRFELVRQGRAEPGVGPLRVIAFLGDNIQDFPGLSQAARGTPGALDQFGAGWFMLPNPMYGSWERNPDR